MTIKFGNFANPIVRSFVVIWEAPIDALSIPEVGRLACGGRIGSGGPRVPGRFHHPGGNLWKCDRSQTFEFG